MSLSKNKAYSAEKLRELLETDVKNGVDVLTIQRRFGKPPFWFVVLQCPRSSEFRREYYDERGLSYMFISKDASSERWGVKRAKGARIDLPVRGEVLKLIKVGTVDITTLLIETTENFLDNRRATLTLICRKIS